MISVAHQRQGLVIRVTGTDHFLAWPEPSEIVLPLDLITGATYHPALSTLPDRTQLFWNVGHGMGTLPVVRGQWAFGRRQVDNEGFYFAVRGPDTPVLVVTARDWELNGVVVSTPHAAEIAAGLATLGDVEEHRCRVS